MKTNNKWINVVSSIMTTTSLVGRQQRRRIRSSSSCCSSSYHLYKRKTNIVLNTRFLYCLFMATHLCIIIMILLPVVVTSFCVTPITTPTPVTIGRRRRIIIKTTTTTTRSTQFLSSQKLMIQKQIIQSFFHRSCTRMTQNSIWLLFASTSMEHSTTTTTTTTTNNSISSSPSNTTTTTASQNHDDNTKHENSNNKNNNYKNGKKNINNNKDDPSILPIELIEALDLDKLFILVSKYTTTRRGQQAILHLVQLDDSSSTSTTVGSTSAATMNNPSSSKRKQILEEIMSYDTFRSSMINTRAGIDGTSIDPFLNNNIDNNDDDWYPSSKQQSSGRIAVQMNLAKTVREAKQNYDLVEQAMFTIDHNKNILYNVTLPPFSERIETSRKTNHFNIKNRRSNNNKGDNDHDDLYDIRTLDDYDEWFTINSPSMWTLEHIIQVEQMLHTFIKFERWSQSEMNLLWVPLLTNHIQTCFTKNQTKSSSSSWSRNSSSNSTSNSNTLISTLRDLYDHTVKGTVVIQRGIRTIMDPTGQSSYQFQLNETKYPIFSILRNKQTTLFNELQQLQSQQPQENKKGQQPKPSQQQYKIQESMNELEEEILSKQKEITLGLVWNIYQHLQRIQEAFTCIVELDIIYAKAYFGMNYYGKIPRMNNQNQYPNQKYSTSSTDLSNGRIMVPQFIHPLLIASSMTKDKKKNIRNQSSSSSNQQQQQQRRTVVVPIDLQLDHKRKGLIISGSNGGGKTLALKSFGLVALMAKCGIPIPSIPNDDKKNHQSMGMEEEDGNNATSHPQSNTSPIVDYFDQILTVVGDQQNVNEGESTYTAQLKKYSTIIDTVQGSYNDHENGNENNNDEKIFGVQTALSLSKEPSYLVLLDELGSGTDETAGSAIGRAVLEKLLETKSCRIIATTHSAKLKAYSFHNNDQIGCAAVLLEKITTLSPTEYDENHKNDESSDPTQQQQPNRLRRSPVYKLQYDIIGESYGYDAAVRCEPPFPNDVLNRITELMKPALSTGQNNNNNNLEDESSTLTTYDTPVIDMDYTIAISKSIEKQLAFTEMARSNAEQNAQDIAAIQKAMVVLAKGYDERLNQLIQRVDYCYQDLKNQQYDRKVTVEVVGETLSELRTVKKQVRTEAEVLKDMGLKIMSTSYNLTEGETVVIIAGYINENGIQYRNWDGDISVTGTIGSRDLLSREEQLKLRPNDVVVVPTMSVWDGSFPTRTESSMTILGRKNRNDGVDPGTVNTWNQTNVKPLILKRYHLAVWDYNIEPYKFNNNGVSTTKGALETSWVGEVRSVRDAQRRLNDILLNLGDTKSLLSLSNNNDETITTDKYKKKNPAITNNNFASARDRKAAKMKAAASASLKKKKKGKGS